MTNQLKCIQQLGLEALSELQKFCSRNNIKFFLRGGSVLGAVKYGGFIPWDDDIDIAVPREEYDRLISLCEKKQFSEKFHLESYLYNPEIHCYFPRILLNEEYREQYGLEKNNTMGLVLIDVLPLDGAPAGRIDFLFYCLRVYLYRLLASLWTVDQKETVNMHSGMQNALITLLYRLNIHKFYTQEGIYKRLDEMYRKRNWKNSKSCGTITGSLFRKEIMPREYWGEGVIHRFETEQFLIPEKYDAYLKHMYGEKYMTEEPEVNKRKSHQVKSLN